MGDEEEAVARLQRIARRAREEAGGEFGPFEALGEFLATDGCALTLLPGNHDVELCLPGVRRCLASLLGTDGTSGRRYEFLHDGEACIRGRVLIEHGNRYDPLNNVDHSRLRQERAQLSRGLPVAEADRAREFFRPPLGTQLVVYAFNPLLAACPFLNLVKPERSAALPLLLALHPDVGRVVRELFWLFPIQWQQWTNRTQGSRPSQAGNYAGGGDAAGQTVNNLDQFLSRTLGAGGAASFADPEAARLAGALSPAGGLHALAKRAARLAQTARDQLVTLVNLARGQVNDLRLDRCRVALQWVRDDAMFEPTDAGPELDYPAAARELLAGGRFDAVIFGHTHLAKDLTFPGGGRYLNAGTWADLIRLPSTPAADGPEVDNGMDAVLGTFLADMAAHRLEKYLLHRLTYVEARLDETGRVEEIALRRWGGEAAPPGAGHRGRPPMSVPPHGIGKLLVADSPQGTAWVVAPGWALTAWHCLEDVVTDDPMVVIHIHFPDRPTVVATLVDRCLELDAALLSLDTSGLVPLPLIARPVPGGGGGGEPSGVAWNALGYPAALPEFTTGVAVRGMVDRFHAHDHGCPILQLGNGTFVGVPNSPDRLLGGISGAPAALDGYGDLVVAMIRRSPPATGEQIICAAPIEEICRAFAGRLPNLALAPWPDAARRWFVDRPPAAPEVRTNISPAAVRAAWGEGEPLREIACNLRRTEAGPLADALLRVAIHAPRIGTFVAAGRDAWAARFQQLRAQWLPLLHLDLGGAGISFQEHTGRAEIPGGLVRPDVAGLAQTIQQECDQWVLDKLHEAITMLVEDNAPQRWTNFFIARDVRESMATTWADWHPRLADAPGLLHHFLALMVTADGAHDSASRAAAGAGPRTLGPCLLPTLAFSLALSPCLHEPLGPKHQQPGNLGVADTDGHACGIEMHEQSKLHLSLQEHHWPTHVVLLPHLPYAPDEWDAANVRLDGIPGAIQPTLDRTPPRWLLLPGDEGIHKAIAKNLAAVRACLAGRQQRHREAQERYCAAAGGGIR